MRAAEEASREVEWLITTACNYRCSYCLCARGRHASAAAVAQVLDFTANRLQARRLNLCGGEPTLHPQLLEVARFCRGKGVLLSLDSNLSPSSERLLAVYEAGRPCFDHLHATFHPEFAEFDAFGRRVKTLRRAGLVVEVRLIARHDQFDQTRAIFERMQAAGLDCKLKLEKWRRRADPSMAWPAILAPYAAPYLDWLAEVFGLSVKRILGIYGYHRHRGERCLAGKEYVYIDHRGAVHRCGAAESRGQALGSTADRGLKTLSEPKPCPFDVCKCREADRLGLIVGQAGAKP